MSKMLSMQLVNSSGQTVYQMPQTAGTLNQALIKRTGTNIDWKTVKQVLSQDLILYVDGTNGQDNLNTSDGSQGLPFRTPQFAIDYVENFIEPGKYSTRVQILPGVYSQILRSSDYASVLSLYNLSRLSIVGDLANPNNVIFSTSTNVFFNNGIDIQDCPGCFVGGITFEGNPAIPKGSAIVSINNSQLNIENSNFNHTHSAMYMVSTRVNTFANLRFSGKLYSCFSLDENSVAFFRQGINYNNCDIAHGIILNGGAIGIIENPQSGAIINGTKYLITNHARGINFETNTAAVSGNAGIVDSAKFALVFN